jgi:cobalt-zinc-cadmium efflux system protein
MAADSSRPDHPHSHYHDHDTAHEHSHGHSHGPGHDHSHGIGPDADRKWLLIALSVIAAFMAVEVVAGVIAQSLALISDAAHMLTDAAAIILALVAMRLAARPAGGKYTFGLIRAEILSAQINGLSLLALAAWLAWEAIARLADPPDVTGWMVLATGGAGLIVNIIAAWAISKASRRSLNVEGAYQHVLMDMLASVAAAAAGAVVMLTGFTRADSIATLIVVVLMIRGGWRLLRDSTLVLLNAAPPELDPGDVAAGLLRQDEVVEIHDLHIWSIGSGQPALAAHVLVRPAADCHQVRQRLETELSGLGITHTTLQTDHYSDPDDRHCKTPHGPVHRRA